ncbi:hypothetical protein [Paenibacillus endoradicis]|nr:hypothetical protein [Paenibacillus endoradicis]
MSSAAISRAIKDLPRMFGSQHQEDGMKLGKPRNGAYVIGT